MTHRRPLLRIVTSVLALVASVVGVTATAPTAAADPVIQFENLSATTLNAGDKLSFTLQETNLETEDDAKVSLSLAPVGDADGNGAEISCDDPSFSNQYRNYGNCSIDKPGTYRIVATTGSGFSQSSDPITVHAGPASQVRFTTGPSDITVGGYDFAAPPAIALTDQAGNVVDGADTTLSLGAYRITDTNQVVPADLQCSDTGQGGTEEEGSGNWTYGTGTQNLTGYKLTSHGSTGAFPDCTVNGDPGTYQLAAAAFIPIGTGGSGQVVTGVSEPFQIVEHTAAKLAFTDLPDHLTAGAAAAIKVAVTDAAGTTMETDSTTSVKITPATGGPSLACDGDTATADSGIATFTGCTAQAPGQVTLTATSGTLNQTVTTLTVGPKPAAQIAFSTQPGDGTAGNPLETQPAVSLTDEDGNPASDAVDLALQDASGATLDCLVTSQPPLDGTVTFVGCSVDKPGTYRFVATDPTVPGLSATSEKFTIAAAAAGGANASPSVVFTAQPSGASGGSVFTTQPAVAIRGSDGEPLAEAGATVTIGIEAGTGTPGAQLACTTVPADSGSAAFTGCSIDRAGSGYRLRATSSDPAVRAAVSDPFDVAVGPASALRFTVQPQGARAGGILATQPQVSAVDAGGNVVAAATNTVTLALSGNSSLACDSPSVAITEGRAAFSGCTVGAAGSGYRLTATADGLQQATSDPFDVAGGPAMGAAPKAQPLGQTFGGHDYATNPTVVVDDVNPVTGALSLTADDLTVAGLGVPLQVTRTYNSADTSGGAFGPGWSSVFDAGVDIARNHTATVRGEDGSELTFAADNGLLCRLLGLCKWTAPAGARVTIGCVLTLCTIERADGAHVVSLGGRIISYLAPFGPGLTFGYRRSTLTKVSVARSGGSLTVAVATDGAGHITKLATPTRTIEYGYTNGQLTSVTDPTGATTRYTYANGRLAGTTDAAGAPRLAVTYDRSGRVISAATTGGPQRFSDTYSYPTAGQTIRTTALTANGKPATADYITRYAGNVLIGEQQPSGATLAYSYDAALNLTAIQDPLGRVQTNTFDSHGNQTSQTATDGGVTRWTFNSSHHVTSVTDPLGHTTKYTYFGPLLTSVTDPTGAKTTYRYNLLSERIGETNPTGTVDYTFDAAGNQTGMVVHGANNTSVNGLGPVRTYNEAGAVVTSTDPRGHTASGTSAAWTTTYGYDAAGRLLSVTAPGGAVSTTTYTPAGDVASTTAPGGPETSYAWDEDTLTQIATADGNTVGTKAFSADGSIIRDADATGRATTSVYDLAGRLIAQTDPANVTTTYGYGPMSLVTRAVDSTGQVGAYRYDAGLRLTSSTVNGVTASAGYDLAGQLTSVSDGDGNAKQYSYDAAGRIASVISSAGTTSYAYDGSGNPVAVTDGNGHTTTHTYDALGNVLTTTRGGSTWTYSYDPAGNETGATDPDGRHTAYTLDARNQRTGIVYSQPGHDTITVTQAFDAAGRRTEMTDPTTGTHTYTYTYDGAGNLASATTGSTAPFTGAFTYDYSQPGSVGETYPDGTHITTMLDDAQNVMSVTAPGVAVSYLRDAARRISGIAYGNGLLTSQGYDAAGDLVSQQTTCAATVVGSTRYGYSAGGSPLGSQTTVGGITTQAGYGFDASGRLDAQFSESTGQAAAPAPCTTEGDDSASAEPAGSSAGEAAPVTPGTLPELDLAPATQNPIGYDAVGNRTSQGGNTFSYNASDELTSGSDGSSATYDAAGNLTSSTTASGTTTYGYDAAGRLVNVTLPGGSVVGYSYDGDGNRVSRTANGDTTVFVWDLSGAAPLLAGEYATGGALIRRYIYGAEPVAMQTPTATLYYSTDARGDVTALTDSTGALVASYSYDAFGNVATQMFGESSGPAAQAAAGNPLLFEGQILDRATGLYNMRARNYDPITGRFTQPDPVSPAVGTPAISPYLFAGDDPVGYTDPTGQVAIPSVSQAEQDPAGFAHTMWTTLAYGGHSTESARQVNLAKRSLLITKVGLKAATLAATNAGVLSEAGAKGVGKAGTALGVMGIGLSVFITVEDCQNGSTSQCVGDAVGVAMDAVCLAATEGAGAVACGLASFALSTAITMYGPQMANYAMVGVDYVAGTAPGIYRMARDEVVSNVTSAANVALGVGATGFNVAAESVSSGFDGAIGTLTDAGYSAGQLAGTLADSFSYGADQTAAALTTAGYRIGDIATSVADAFGLTSDQLSGALGGLGFSQSDIADAVAAAIGGAVEVVDIHTALQGVYDAAQAAGDTATQIADAVAGALTDTWGALDPAVVAGALKSFGFGVTDIGQAVFDTFSSTSVQVGGQILAGLGYGANEVAGALRSAWNWQTEPSSASAMLKAIGFGADEIASVFKPGGALADTFTVVGGDVAAALPDIVSGALQQAGFTLSQIGSALKDTLQTTAEDAFNVLLRQSLDYGQAITAMKSVYAVTASFVAQQLHAVGSVMTATVIAGYLRDAYGAGAQTAAQALNAAHFAADQIADALEDAYHASVGAVSGILSGLGINVSSIGGEFASIGSAIADGVTSLGSAIASLF